MYSRQLNFKLLNVIIITIASSTLLQINSIAQDLHFSQPQSIPLFINSANTGISGHDLRVCNSYRNQWSKIDYPYHSYYLSIDGHIKAFNQQIGIGAFFLHDQSSSLYLTADKIYLSLSHTSNFSNNQLVVGIQPGIVMKHFNTNRVTFGSQFDPDGELFDPGLPSNEYLLNDKMRYFDLNLGILWRSQIQNLFVTAGFSANHINMPVESFFSENDSTRLPVKYTFHSDIRIPVLKKFEINPTILYSSTVGAREFVGGILAAYYPKNPDLAVERVFAIFNFRINPVKTVDALIIGAGAAISNLELAITYDFNVSSLRKASNFQGALEVSLIYTITKRKSKGIIEPCIML